MERDLTYVALDAIAFVTGAALSAMLGHMQWRVDRATGRMSGYLLLWVLGFIWTFGNFMRCTLELAGARPDSAGARFAETFAWSCTLLGPLAIGRMLQGGIGSTSRTSRGVFASLVAVSLLNLVLMVRANHLYAFQLEASGYPTASFYIALGVGLTAFVIYLRERKAEPGRKAMPRWFAPAALLFATTHTTAILLSTLATDMPETLRTATNLIARHWTIPWSILIAVSLAQAHYADVVAKRSLWLLASITVATIVSMTVIDVSPGLPLLATALVMSALMLATPQLVRAIEALVDKVILARPDFEVATRTVDEAFRRATTKDEAIATALSSVRSTLHVEASYSETLDEQPTEKLCIATTHEARSLMQPELAFLASIRTRLDHRLEAIRFEAEQRALLLREERLRRLLTEAELKALRTQVDPHFLFNTLNTIADLITTNPEQAERMTERLAECFRYALATHSRNFATLDEELSFARHYLDIEQVRFGERLIVKLSRGNAVGNEAIPSLLLQPLLENAIRHGLAPVREGGTVTVSAHHEGERLRVIVEDDGVGLGAGVGNRAGVGLRNVQERLHTLYGQTAEFIIGARPGGRGTSVTLVIPLHAY
jgi:two-component sensor histidine kinase